MSTPTRTTHPTKVFARVAMLNLSDAQAGVLSECFKQFNIRALPVATEWQQILKKEKFEGCVLQLDDPAVEPLLQLTRNTLSSRSMLIYGLTSDPRFAMRFSKYGINAMFTEPLDRVSCLKVVRATHLLAVHEFRRYVRIPMVVEVDLTSRGQSANCYSQEISSGGMSLETRNLMPDTAVVRASFAMPNSALINIGATICWRREGMLGIRFDPNDRNRATVRNWIDNYLELS